MRSGRLHRFPTAWDERPSSCDDRRMDDVEVSALAINVVIPAELRWTAERRGEAFELQTLNVRLLPSGRLAARAYGRPVAGGRAGYVSFPVPQDPQLDALVEAAATRAGALWAGHDGMDR